MSSLPSILRESSSSSSSSGVVMVEQPLITQVTQPQRRTSPRLSQQRSRQHYQPKEEVEEEDGDMDYKYNNGVQMEDVEEDEDDRHHRISNNNNKSSYSVQFHELNPFIFIRNLPRNLPPVRCHINHPIPNNKKITLVLDLDETLVHCSIEPMPGYEFNFKVNFNRHQYVVYVRRRPFLKEFLETVSKWFEVIVFTASQSVYADKLLDILDPEMTLFSHRLFRDACVCIDGNYLKDLRVLGRDLSRAAIIDNSPQAFGFHVDNGIPIESWFDDDSDQELRRILPFLDQLRQQNDVRPMIRETFQLHRLVEGPQPYI